MYAYAFLQKKYISGNDTLVAGVFLDSSRHVQYIVSNPEDLKPIEDAHGRVVNVLVKFAEQDQSCKIVTAEHVQDLANELKDARDRIDDLEGDQAMDDRQRELHDDEAEFDRHVYGV